MIRRKLSLAAAVVTATALTLTACSGGEAPAADTTKISIMAPFLEAQPPSADGAVQQKLEELTGKDISITWTPNASYEDKMNITLASAEIPQVMVVQSKSPGFVKNAEAGAFWDLTDKLDEYPNLKTTFPEVAAERQRQRQGLRRLPRPRPDARGRDVPQGLAGQARPEGTGNHRGPLQRGQGVHRAGPGRQRQERHLGHDHPEVGRPGLPTARTTSSKTWFGAGNRWTERDGKLVPSFDTEEFLEANRFVKKMVDEELINPDFATFDGTKWNEPFFNGKGGIIVDVDSRVSVLINLFKQANPNDFENKVGFVGNLKGPDGELHAHPTDGYSGFLAIPKTSVRTEAELKNVLAVPGQA